MKFAVNRLDFIKALEPTIKAASGKQMTILGNVLLTAESGKIKLCGYNLSVAVAATVSAAIDEQGSACVDGRAIAEFIRRCEEPNVIVDTVDRKINVKCGKARTSFMYAQSEDYPEVDSLPNTADEVTLKTNELFNAIKKAGYAAADDCSRKALECINILIDKNMLKLISCDGYRAAVFSENLSARTSKSANFGLFKNDIKTIMSIISSDDITLRYTNKHLEFKSENVTVRANLSSEQYPNIEAQIKKNYKTANQFITVDSGNLKETLLKVMALPKIGTDAPLRIDVSADKMQFLYNFGNGIFTDEIECELKGEPFTVGVKAAFLSDMLKSSDGSVVLNCNGPAGPIVVSNENISQMIMPMRLRK